MTLYETVILNAQRLSEGRTMAEMARTIGKSPQWMNRAVRGERGRGGMTLGTVELLARALETDPIDLLLPVLSEAEERALIFLSHRLAHWLQDAAIRIRELARARGSRDVVLGAIRAHGHAWELGASLGAILSPPVCGPAGVVGDGSVYLCPTLGAPCPYHENRSVLPDVPDSSECCLGGSHQGSPSGRPG